MNPHETTASPHSSGSATSFTEPSWVKDELTRQYFHREWQHVPHTQQAMFEHLCLLTFQNGLWWSLVLAKREALRQRFHNFEPAAVAHLTTRDIEKMLVDPSIIRNKSKIYSCIKNAQALLEHEISLPQLFGQAFPEPLIIEGAENLPRTLELTDRLSAQLRAAGLQRTGPVVCCSLAQAAGYIQLQC